MKSVSGAKRKEGLQALYSVGKMPGVHESIGKNEAALE